MFGTIVKYTAVAFVGACTFGVCLFVTDDDVVSRVKDLLETKHRELLVDASESESVNLAMRVYIAENRDEWDKLYLLASTGRRIQELYAKYN